MNTTTKESALSVDFILAGRAVFTVDNGKGTHYTFRITKKQDEGREPIWFAGLLTGPDNTSDYTYMGVVQPRELRLFLTKKSRFREDSTPVKVLDWTLNHIYMNLPLPAGYSVHHEGRCGRCGRTLTVPESIESGIGPECAKMMDL